MNVSRQVSDSLRRHANALTKSTKITKTTKGWGGKAYETAQYVRSACGPKWVDTKESGVARSSMRRLARVNAC
jgi:hypothetical protein